MIRIRLGGSTLDRMRLAVSPLWELVCGVQMVHRLGDRGRAPWPYRKWADHARTVLRTSADTAALHVYAQLYGVEHGRPTPDVFVPVPLVPQPTLEEQLCQLRDTPATVVREQFAKHYPEGTPEYLEPYRSDPPGAFASLADAMDAFWKQAIAPHWPAMRTVLDEEILLRASTLAGHGPEAVLSGVHGNAHWEPPVLSLPKRNDSEHSTIDQRLLLVPLVFAEGRMMCSTDHPDVLMLTYQARGSAVLDAAATAAPATDRLGQLVGPGRAAVLRALRQPATTSSLAAILGRSPSTVSEHLAALHEAGVVSRIRLQRQVFYRLEASGAALLATFDLAG